MNEHLKPVFVQIIPAIENAGIKYWVYGGIAFAAMTEQFYRKNDDVDIFVLENEFDNLYKLLNSKWTVERSDNRLGRPKIKVIIGDKKRLEAIPVVKTDEGVEFYFHEGPKMFSMDILKKVVRFIGGFRFVSPENNFLKELFISYLENRQRGFPKGIKDKRIKDARQILSKEEFYRYLPRESYK